MTEQRKIPKTQTFNRLLARGVDHTDYAKLVQRVDDGEDHVQVCEELGDKSYTYAEEELKKGHKNTARIFYMKAASLYRIGAYDLIYFTDEKIRIYEKELDSFSRGIQLHENMKAEKIELPYKNSKMCGWMLIPNQAPKDVPVIVTTAGITGFKEEVHPVAMMMVERGFAVLNIDGPGQGESFYANKCYLEIDTQDAHNVVLDYILSRSDVGNKIGLYGLCFGGNLVARTAGCFPDKVAACVSVGGAYVIKEALRFNRAFLDIAAYRFGKSDQVEHVRHNLAPQFNLEGIAEKITCPLLIIHNDPDPLIKVKNVERLYNEAASLDKTIKIYPGSDHNAHNDNTEATTYVVDWFADRLLK